MVFVLRLVKGAFKLPFSAMLDSVQYVGRSCTPPVKDMEVMPLEIWSLS
jgi:hypothetical protein